VSRDKEELHLLHEIREEQKRDHRLLEEILHFVKPKPATGFQITQQGDSNMSAASGVPSGGSSNFTQVPTPAGGALQTGSIPVWSADDPQVQAALAPSADGTSCVVSVPAGDTQGSAAAGAPGSFNLTVSGTASDGTAISSSVNVPILAPTPVPATGFDIEQQAASVKFGSAPAGFKARR